MAYDPGAGISYSQGSSPYDAARVRATQRADTAGQAGNEAMQRRYAAMGGLNSGSAIKSEMLNNQNTQQQKEDSLRGIDSQEIGENNARNFQANQATQQQGFASNEAQKARDAQNAQFGANLTFQKEQAYNAMAARNRQLDLESRGLDQQRLAEQEGLDRQKYNEYQDSNFGSQRNIGKMAGGLLGQGSGAGVAALFSDRRLKKNIVELAVSIFKDVPTYVFEYINKAHGEGLRIGTMAQDLLASNPDHPAVLNSDEGFMVDYSLVEGK